jgi:hypothetical protein
MTGNRAARPEIADPGRSSLDRDGPTCFDVGSRKKFPLRRYQRLRGVYRGHGRYPATRRATTKP